jgi:hypothetical protein
LGKPYTRTDSICKAGKILLTDSGVDEAFGFYSTRHALINWLYTHGYDEKQVNAYTGHSNNYHTTLNFYYHLDTAWIGGRLARAGEATLLPVSQAAQNMIQADVEATSLKEAELESALGSEAERMELEEEDDHESDAYRAARGRHVPGGEEQDPTGIG